MGRAGLSTAGVVGAALHVIDGGDVLTLAAVASRTSVAPPSLYKHVGSLADLRNLVAVRIMDEMTERFTAIVLGHSGDAAVAALMREYRAYARRHPARYAAIPADPLQDPALAAAGTRMLNVFLAVLRGCGLQGSAAIHVTRCLRAAVHGFAIIEINHGFGLPEDLDETYERLVRMFTANLPQA